MNKPKRTAPPSLSVFFAGPGHKDAIRYDRDCRIRVDRLAMAVPSIIIAGDATDMVCAQVDVAAVYGFELVIDGKATRAEIAVKRAVIADLEARARESVQAKAEFEKQREDPARTA